jgi:hypothetical protein
VVENVGSRFDTSTAHPARRYDYLLSGKDNFAADRESAEQLMKAMPSVRLTALENRAFLRRVVGYLAHRGVRQFLDIGTGLPTTPNVHEVAQAIIPDARVVYVDNDPIVLAHARALLTSSSEGRTTYLDEDLRRPELIISDPEVRQTLDFSQPVALLLLAILHFVTEDMRAYEIVSTLTSVLPSGSYLALSHFSYDPLPQSVRTTLDAMRGASTEPIQDRSLDDLTPFFTGFDLVEPGIVPVSAWRDGDRAGPRPDFQDVALYGSVGVKR